MKMYHLFLQNKYEIDLGIFSVMRFVLLVIIFFIGASFFSYAEKYSPSCQNLSLEIIHQPTEKVIRQLSLLSGYKIDIDQQYNNIPISIEIQCVDLNRALIEVLKSLRVANHAILMDEDNKTAGIIILPSTDDAHTPMVGLTGGKEDSDKARYGISASHLKQIKQNYYNRTLSPDDIVSPPSDDGSKPGMTRQELETIKENYQNRKKQMPGDTIVSPPSPEGKPGHSLAEVERIKREYRQNKSRY